MPHTRRDFLSLTAKAATYATGRASDFRVTPGETVSVNIGFATPRYLGERLFLFHCHNLEHEDQGMMLNVNVTEAGGGEELV